MIHDKDCYVNIYDEKLNIIAQLRDIESLTVEVSFSSIGSLDFVTLDGDEEVLQEGFFATKNGLSAIFYIAKVQHSRTITGIEAYRVQATSCVDILNWRVIEEPVTFLDTRAEVCANQLISDNISNKAKKPERKIDLIRFDVGISTQIEPDPQYGAVYQVGRGSLYDAVRELLDSETGLKAVLRYDTSKSLATRQSTPYISFISYDKQDKSDTIIFSEGLKNIKSFSLENNLQNSKNVAVVAGEGEGINREVEIIGSATGLDRRELYIDARDLQKETDQGLLNDAQYRLLLQQRGTEKLNDYGIVWSGVFEVDNSYYKDMDLSWLGYICKIRIDDRDILVYIDEITEIYDSTGRSIFPTFRLQQEYFLLATEDGKDLLTENEDEILINTLIEEE